MQVHVHCMLPLQPNLHRRLFLLRVEVNTISPPYTCPIDNYLTMFHLLLHEHNNLLNYLVNSTEEFAAILVQVKSMFDSGQFPHGKLLWLSQFQGHFNLNSPIIDVWGNDDLFLSRLQPVLPSTYSGKCSSGSCPAPLNQYTSQNISCSEINTPPPGFLQSSLDKWMSTECMLSQCGSTIYGPLQPGSPHFFLAMLLFKAICARTPSFSTCCC